MRHDERAHQTRRDAPRGSPYILIFILLGEELHVKGFRKILTQEVRRTGLQRFDILHHRLNTIGIQRARETLVGGLDSFDNRNRHHTLRKIRIDIQHLTCVILCLLLGGMGSVPLLPEELGSTQEETRTHLPTHHITPLVAENRQVAVRRDPVLVGAPDDGLRSRTDDQLFLQLCLRIDYYAFAIGVVHQAVMGHDCTLFGETFHMLRLTAEERFRNQEGEIGIFYPFLFETTI